MGAEVTGVCGTRNAELVRSIGAARVVDYTTEDFTRDRQRYDVILGNVLNRPPPATARLLTPRGVLIPNCRLLLRSGQHSVPADAASFLVSASPLCQRSAGWPMLAGVRAFMMGPVEILVVLDRVEPPGGRLRVVSPRHADRPAKDKEIRFTGWLGLLRALYEVTGAADAGGPAGGEGGRAGRGTARPFEGQ